MIAVLQFSIRPAVAENLELQVVEACFQAVFQNCLQPVAWVGSEYLLAARMHAKQVRTAT